MESLQEKRACIESNWSLTISKQSELLEINRSSYYSSSRKSQIIQKHLDAIDEVYTMNPSYWQRRIKRILKRDYGIEVWRKKIRTYMKLLSIEPIYPKPKTSIPNKQHKIYPYLLKWIEIQRINQVWSTDITYIRMAHWWIYLVAIIDWYSRKVLSWKISNSMEVQFCIDCLEESFLNYDPPEIFNTDQWSQFTSKEFTDILLWNNIQISMDWKWRWMDNVIIERLWRSVKQEEVYINQYDSPQDAYYQLKSYFEKYNSYRPHQSLDYETPDSIYFGHEFVKKSESDIKILSHTDKINIIKPVLTPIF